MRKQRKGDRHLGQVRPARDLPLQDLFPRRAFIATSNLDLDLLTDLVQTRFQAVRLDAPSAEKVAAFLAARWPAPAPTIQRLVLGSGGNVRAALADPENFFDAGA